MTPEDFVAKWKAMELHEKQAAQSHFNDLCDLLEVPKPADSDPSGKIYAFEKPVKKPGGAQGYADVWKKGCFAWEYKGDLKNLVKAYAQIKDYADALENPPLLIVSDMKEIRVHTNFTNAVAEQHVFKLFDLIGPSVRGKLRTIWTDPESWKPTKSREAVTRDAAVTFAAIAQKLRGRGHDPRAVAHFLNKIVFCLFAEDIGLLPDRVFADVVEESVKDAGSFEPMLHALFRAMREKNGFFGPTRIPWFNGGLFDDDEVLPLRALDLPELAAACRLDWGAIDPYIFGTLFEKGLDPERRKEMASLFDPKNGKPDPAPGLFSKHQDKAVGVHYTDPDTIMKIVEPVVLRPWRAEWETVKTNIAELRTKKAAARSAGAQTKIENDIREAYMGFRERLGKFRVLDPACGSGNFLYLALRHLKDFDLQVLDEARALELPLDNQRVTPECVRGIEINPYAAELAKVTVWIGEIQWQMRNGGGVKRSPILGKLDGIVCKDALLNQGMKSEAKWPKADVVIGNPPFLGGKLLRTKLGNDYVENLFAVFHGRVPAEADLVAYWFAKSWELIRTGELSRAGLVATNSIRGGASRRVLDVIAKEGIIFDVWDDEPWVLDGAAVRVSLIAIAPATANLPIHFDGRPATQIHADLTTAASNLTAAKRISQNSDVAFMGDTKGGAFDVSGDLARKWLTLPTNPNGRRNRDVLRPWVNGMDVTRRSAEKWIIDFGWEMSESEASLYEAPFAHCLTYVKPERDKNRRELYRLHWWRHVEPRPGMWRALKNLNRYVVSPTVAKHRLFAWLPATICPDHQLIAIARDDDTTFGILHSRFHELWALRLGTSLEDRPRYTPSTTFETFPFPDGLTPNIPAADYADDPRARKIAEAAKRLNELREAWLNPPDLVKRQPEVVPGYPDRILPRNEKAAAELKKRTLTNLYNQRPTWLANAHKALDEAVAAAYGWPADLPDEEVLARLFALNQERAAAQNAASPEPKAKKAKAKPAAV